MALARSWFQVSLDAWALTAESSAVMGLRILKIAGGGAAADAETQRMVSEKVEAALTLQALAISGGMGLIPHRVAGRTVAHYRRKVRANRRRLMRG